MKSCSNCQGNYNKKNFKTSKGHSKTDTQSTTDIQATEPHDKTVNNPLTHVHVDSDDDFMPISVKKLSKHPSTWIVTQNMS